MITKQWAQGDVLVSKLEKLPEGVEITNELKEKVIALGETSGHRHVLVADRESEVVFTERDGKTYMEVRSGTATLGHWVGETRTKADHDALTFDLGIYRISTQREYNEMGDRKVVD